MKWYLLAIMVPNNTLANKNKAKNDYKVRDIEIHAEICEGEFGKIYKGIVRKCQTEIVIKTLSESVTPRQRENFVKHINFVKNLKTNHIVEIRGFIISTEHRMVFMEFMYHGNLRSFLRRNRQFASSESAENYFKPQNTKFSLRSVEFMALEIADGMAYLEAQGVAHGDLAARNCFVANDLTVKIGDFGLTRKLSDSHHQRHPSKMYSVRWHAPENIASNAIYTAKSDVFSFGIVLWELVTFGDDPYPGIPDNLLVSFVENAGIMQRPVNCSNIVHELMQKCWKFKPENRISFKEAVEMLLNYASEKFKRLSYYHSQMT